jgi:hypothetical protein
MNDKLGFVSVVCICGGKSLTEPPYECCIEYGLVCLDKIIIFVMR